MSEQDIKIDLKDITATRYIRYRPFMFIVLSILCFILFGIFLCVGNSHTPVSLIMLALGVVFLIIFFVAREDCLKIEYVGGNMRFSLNGCKTEVIRSFQKSVHFFKDKA